MLLHLYSSLFNKHFSLAFLKPIWLVWPLAEEQIPATLWPQAVEKFGLLRHSELRFSIPMSHSDTSAAPPPSCFYVLLKFRGNTLDLRQAPSSQHQFQQIRHLGSPAAYPTHVVPQGGHTTAQRQEQEPREACWRLNRSCLHLAQNPWISGLQQVGSSSTEAHLGSLGRRYQALHRCYQAFRIIENRSNLVYETTWGGGEPVLHSQDLIILKN